WAHQRKSRRGFPRPFFLDNKRRLALVSGQVMNRVRMRFPEFRRFALSRLDTPSILECFDLEHFPLLSKHSMGVELLMPREQVERLGRRRTKRCLGLRKELCLARLLSCGRSVHLLAR